VFLTGFFLKHLETLRILQRLVLNILRWSNEGRMPTNNDPQTKLGYDTGQRLDESKSKICRMVTIKKEKKNNHDLGCVKQSPSWSPTQSLCPRFFRVAPKWKQKRKRLKPPKPNYPPKSSFLNVLLIHDFACYLWFDRKWFAKSSHDISMVQN